MRIAKLITVSLAVSSAVLAAATAVAQGGPGERPPFSQNTDSYGNAGLDGWLETRLDRTMTNCLGYELFKVRNSRITAEPPEPEKDGMISALPNYLANGLGITSAPGQNPHIVQVTPSGGIPANRLYNYFTNIYAADLTNGKSADPSSLLEIRSSYNPADLIEITPHSGQNSAAYSASCSNVINAKLQAGVTLPLASIKSALNSQYDGSNTYALNLVYGHFASGLYSALSDLGGLSAVNRVHNLSVGFAVWDWYRAHPDRQDSDNWLLAWLDGVTVYQEYGHKVQTSANASASLTPSLIPYTSLSAETSDTMSFTTESNAKAYELAVLIRPGTNLLSWQFMPLVKPAVLRESLARNLRQTWVSDGPVALADASVDLTGWIDGLPGCDWAVWQAYGPSADQGSVTLKKLEADATLGTQGCKATLSYTPSVTLKSQGGTVTFGLRNSLSGNLALELVFPPLNLSGVDLPRLALNNDPGPVNTTPRVSGGYIIATWTVKYILQMDVKYPIKTASALRFRNLKLQCQKLGAIDVKQDPQPNFMTKTDPDAANMVAQSIELPVTVSIPANAFTDLMNGYDTCDISGDPVQYDLFSASGVAYHKPAYTFPFQTFQVQLPVRAD